MAFNGDEFRIDSYIDHHSDIDLNPSEITMKEKIEVAKKWAETAMRTIIYPTETQRELEELWMNFQMMPHSHRRQSDNESLRIFGMLNQVHYEKLLQDFLPDDIADVDIDNVSEAAVEMQPSDHMISKIISAKPYMNPKSGDDYCTADIEAAKQWSEQSGYPIIYPTKCLDELEILWSHFNSYPIRIRRISNSYSTKFFGIDNETHYNELKSKFLEENIKDSIVEESYRVIGEPLIDHLAFAKNDSVDTSTRAKDLLSISIRNNETYEDAIIANVVDKATGEYRATHQNIRYDAIPYEDLPFFTPEEMIDFGVNQANPEDNFYGCEPIQNIVTDVMAETSEEWFNKYNNIYCGIPVDGYDPIKWKDAVATLMLRMKTAKDKEPYKQAILNLGWSPEAEFSPENRVKAKTRIKMKASDNTGSTQFVDLTGMDAEELSEGTVISDTGLKPVFIVLEEGKSLFSGAIKAVTKSNYSHAAISFDPSMKTMYSYGIENSVNGIAGGFIEEHIEDKLKHPDTHFGVFAIFLKEEDWNKLKFIVEDFMHNAKKTAYGYLNILISHIFRIPFNRDKRMVCSQFVDKLLKLIDIDISKKNSSLVSPADFEKFAKENKKIYILFNDYISKFKPSRIKALTTKLTKKAQPIKEYILWRDPVGIVFEMINNISSLDALQELSTKIDLGTLNPRIRSIYETMIQPSLFAENYLSEAKEFPIQFDKDGNLFVKNIKKRDYEAEYSKSHKLLKKYEESGNIDGIKYELCRLWAMNAVIEEKLHSKKSSDTSKEVKARAKILNDFNYYLKKVLDSESDFNFEEYYSKSPYNDAVIKINRSTIIWSGKLLRTIMTGFE